MGKKDMLSVIDENGNENIVKLVTYFTLVKNDKDYVAYTEFDNENKDGNVKIYVGEVNINNNKIYLSTVSSNEDIESVKDVFVSLSNNPEEGFDFYLNNIDILTKSNMKIVSNIENIFILKEVFVNNIIDNYEYILSSQEKMFEYVDKKELFVELDNDIYDLSDIENYINSLNEYKVKIENINESQLENNNDQTDYLNNDEKILNDTFNFVSSNNNEHSDINLDINSDNISIDNEKIDSFEDDKNNLILSIEKIKDEIDKLELELSLHINNDSLIEKEQLNNSLEKLDNDINNIHSKLKELLKTDDSSRATYVVDEFSNIDKKMDYVEEDIHKFLNEFDNKFEMKDKIDTNNIFYSTESLKEDIDRIYKSLNTMFNNNDSNTEIKLENVEVNKDIYHFEENIDDVCPISIDKQIKIDLNNEKKKYLNILKQQIENEIIRIDNENMEFYNN